MGRDSKGRNRQGKEAVAVDDAELSELVSLISSLDATYRVGSNTDTVATAATMTTTHSEEAQMMTDNLNDNNNNNDVCQYCMDLSYLSPMTVLHAFDVCL